MASGGSQAPRSAAGVEGGALDPTHSSPTAHIEKIVRAPSPRLHQITFRKARFCQGYLYSTSQLPASLFVLRIELGYANTRVWYRQLRGTIYVRSAQEGSDISPHQAESDEIGRSPAPFWLSCVASAQTVAEMRTARFRRKVQTSKRGSSSVGNRQGREHLQT